MRAGQNYLNKLPEMDAQPREILSRDYLGLTDEEEAHCGAVIAERAVLVHEARWRELGHVGTER